MQKILIVFGTRPEAIKMAPLVKAFLQSADNFVTKVCVTAQHREMLDQVIDFFEIIPDYDLNLMKPSQNLYQLTADVLTGLKTVFEDFQPDYVFVHGDTTTSTAAAMGAFYNQSRVCHVEAGLRTFDKWSPFPEEMNRQITGRLADLHFAPTLKSKQNLMREGVSEAKIIVVGNTVIDGLNWAVEKLKSYENRQIRELKDIVGDKKIILVTGHRRENFGQGFIEICNAIKEISKRDDVQLIYPVHLNPNVQTPVYNILSGCDNVNLIEPLSYPSFVWLMSKSHIILTDSGGIQEEAPSLGKPVLVMRENTERPEAVEAGTAKLVGTSKEKIVKEVTLLLDDSAIFKAMSEANNPYGDGTAANQILKAIKNYG
ncbi:non-hydrolyzing UDP-N-acetylglucosamine 2-epimerase [Pedobacter endophyticus]|uniref:UDP-N-acetylglucosamine 2-epimerase (non-hydrolyzing) n=1 Tax=Pedobacter endophyticus TaxID=2789740 RepID=A0A7U3SQG9_9SPHI|nr:UDP-N-acetylglucosamine 2-epimerase (non-hydrolyzing) [Pedobacter endophyticus]QPH38351.1 UDP-N-acetylglucosamine 2-epimerase (non-hydrolyzing) [Pedobacter endophyticus]